MANKKQTRLSLLMMGFTLILVMGMLLLNSCGGAKKSSDEETTKAEEEAFLANQPVESGLYDADYYDIVGKNAKKGRFDGRIYFGLTPKTSAINVFENGNRTKIDYLLVLQKPFEKNDSGVYCAVDMKDQPVTVTTDSVYSLRFIHFSDTVRIDFNPKARHTAPGLEILNKINERREKK